MKSDGPTTVTSEAVLGSDARRYALWPATRTFPGTHDQVACARRFVAEVLGPVPVLDEVVILVSELCTNALLHTASGQSGTFAVTVCPGLSCVRVEVRDDGSDQIPGPGPVDASAEDGRGLGLVDLLADQWGHIGDRSSRSVFFELGWKTSDKRGAEDAEPG